MRKVTVCDDCLSDLLRAERLLQHYKEEHPMLKFEVEKFSDSGKLYRKIVRGDYSDIYILDVMMEQISGIEIGGLLNKQRREAAIIYTTASKEHALEAYEVFAQRYLVKPYTAQAFQEAVDFALTFADSKEVALFSVKTKDGVISVDHTKISYVECVSRTLHIHLTDGRILRSIFIRRSFEYEVENLMENGCFQQVHKSFLVNMAQIEIFTQEKITMSDGMIIPVSQKRAAQVKHNYLRYIAGRQA